MKYFLDEMVDKYNTAVERSEFIGAREYKDIIGEKNFKRMFDDGKIKTFQREKKERMY
ncbi:hypothetical protein HQ545_02775 [Candidatus Woesearchaeota archaeon]|nr:hypothetical protein [Candidatus Woesearchaeota archaeon]